MSRHADATFVGVVIVSECAAGARIDFAASASASCVAAQLKARPLTMASGLRPVSTSGWRFLIAAAHISIHCLKAGDPFKRCQEATILALPNFEDCATLLVAVVPC